MMSAGWIVLSSNRGCRQRVIACLYVVLGRGLRCGGSQLGDVVFGIIDWRMFVIFVASPCCQLV